MTSTKPSGFDFMKGIVRENPVFVLLLGMCPTLGITTSTFNGLGMGLAVLLILTLSNLVISLVKNLIPESVRIPGYIVIIATFVTVLGYLIKAWLPALDQSLGIFIPLIVVNCIVLGRAEAFAAKNSPGLAVLDGLSMGLGNLAALTILGTVREFLATGGILSGTPLAVAIPGMQDGFIMAFGLAPGSFIALGLLLALWNQIMKKLDARRKLPPARREGDKA